MLAQEAGLPENQILPALKRAVALQPDFDDAHYMLALIEKNAGHSEAALTHLLAMQNISSRRRFAYWSALADALLDIGRREECRGAAMQAYEHAATAAEREHALQLTYMAGTELAVQFTRDPDGRAQLTTTRAPRGAPDWNPFVESGDRMQRVDGTLKEIDCAGDITRFALTTAGGALTLLMRDPSRVQLRNAPGGSFEFTCGPQAESRITVEYAAPEPPEGEGLLRAIEFH